MRGPCLSCDSGVVLRCLIVDDNSRFLHAVRGVLEREGITVVGVASSIAEALRNTADLRPDIVLVDIDLGGESGFEVVRRLQTVTGASATRAILISTHAEEDYADLIAASPAVGFLPKITLSGDTIRSLLGLTQPRGSDDDLSD
jgi:DNA-binding NarL/FixJ family response regulator